MGDQINPLLSELKSDSGVHVALHPLVLLTISDYITRHTLRQQKGHVIGALMGQQNGRDITLEHAYECKPMTASAPSFDYAWFESRLQQSKTGLLYLSRTTH
jgi:COP9 signalosome complex subunit 6